ncbi:hypothetical protein [Paracoccus sp. (in: a-proteobacteria)]|uniref:DUF983 domain-containing protein n=1 Tax=Paracoccus sp. TaxID=267 RepID=UPI0028AF4C72|nr:hypothetical protein [Paracoccus sp. (in: a-proteobacteria)]
MWPIFATPMRPASWVAFGRLPEACFDEAWAEVRSELKEIAEGYNLDDGWPVSDDELLLFLDSVNEADPYGQAKYDYPGFHRCMSILTKTPLMPLPFLAGIKSQGLRDEGGYREAAFVEAAENCIFSALERARLKVLLALMEGKISSKGIAVPEKWRGIEIVEWPEGVGDEVWEADPSPIPASEWTSSPQMMLWHVTSEGRTIGARTVMPEERNERTAAARGFIGRCPNCGKDRLFQGYLKVVRECESCGEQLGSTGLPMASSSSR